MRATILLATLKRTEPSNTEALCGFLAGRMERAQISVETIKLVNHRIPPGTESDMGDGDEWPAILDTLQRSEIIIVATPIWWNNQSSIAQRVIERLDAIHDIVMSGKPSPFEGKCGGVVITGDSDGAQHVIANICNFFNAIGVVVPPYATLSVLWERQAKHQRPSREELLAKYEKDYAKAADTMVQQLKKIASIPGP